MRTSPARASVARVHFPCACVARKAFATCTRQAANQVARIKCLVIHALPRRHNEKKQGTEARESLSHAHGLLCLPRGHMAGQRISLNLFLSLMEKVETGISGNF